MWNLLKNTGEWIESDELPTPDGYSKAIFVDGMKEVVRLQAINHGETVWVAVV